jgi:hypothetical protein
MSEHYKNRKYFQLLEKNKMTRKKYHVNIRVYKVDLLGEQEKREGPFRGRSHGSASMQNPDLVLRQLFAVWGIFARIFTATMVLLHSFSKYLKKKWSLLFMNLERSLALW